MHTLPPRPSLTAHSAEFLRGLVQSGEWQDFLPSERTLCKRLGISRPTLRVALAQLERRRTGASIEQAPEASPCSHQFAKDNTGGQHRATLTNAAARYATVCASVGRSVAWPTRQ